MPSKFTRTIASTIMLAAAAGLGLPSQAAAMEKVCSLHFQEKNPAKHDPTIQHYVQAYALLLEDGFFTKGQWDAYLVQLRKGPNASPSAPDLPNADQKVADASIDLHCLAPDDATFKKLPNGEIEVDLDDWRHYVQVAAGELGTGKWTIQQAQVELNKVRPDDRQIAVADFNRDCAQSYIYFQGMLQTGPGGTQKITISSIPH